MNPAPLPYTRGRVTAAAFTSSGDAVMIGTSEGFVELFSLPSGASHNRLRPFREQVNAITVADNHRYAIAGSHKGEVARLDLQTNEVFALERFNSNAHAHATISADGRQAALAFTTRYAGYEGCTLLTLQDDTITHHVTLPKVECQGLWLTADGLFALLDGVVERLETSLERTLWHQAKPPSKVLAFSPQDQTVLLCQSTTHGEDLLLASARTSAQTRAPLRFFSSFTRQSYLLSPVHNLVTAVNFEGNKLRLRCFSLKDGAPLRDQEVDGFQPIAFCPNTAQLLVASLEEEATLYHLQEGRRGLTLRPPNSITQRAALLRRNESVGLLSYERAAGLFLHQKNKPPRLLPSSSGCDLGRLMVSEDASHAVGLDWCGLARLWDLSTARYLGAIQLFSGDDLRGTELPDVLLSQNGAYLAPLRGPLRIFSLLHLRQESSWEPLRHDTSTELENALAPEHQQGWLPPAYDALLSPNGQDIALYHRESGALYLSERDGEHRLLGRGVSGCFRFDHDWHWAAVASARQLRLFSLQQGDDYALVRPHRTKPFMLRFSPTAERLALIAHQTHINPDQRRSKSKLRLPSYDDTAVSYTYDNHHKLTAVHAFVVEVWSLQSKTIEWTLTLEESAALIGVSDDGKQLFLSCGDELRRYQRNGQSGALAERAIALPNGQAIWQKTSSTPLSSFIPALSSVISALSSAIATLSTAIPASATSQPETSPGSKTRHPPARAEAASQPSTTVEGTSLGGPPSRSLSPPLNSGEASASLAGRSEGPSRARTPSEPSSVVRHRGSDRLAQSTREATGRGSAEDRSEAMGRGSAETSAARPARSSLAEQNDPPARSLRDHIIKASPSANTWEAHAADASLVEATIRLAKTQQRQPFLSSLIGPRSKLPNLDLRDVDLAGANLSWADLSGANLSGANLQNANLSGADLSDARLDGASLIGAQLSGAKLEKARLFEATLRWAMLPPKALGPALGALRFLRRSPASSLWRLALNHNGTRLATHDTLGLHQFDLTQRRLLSWSRLPDEVELFYSDDGQYLWALGDSLSVFHNGALVLQQDLKDLRHRPTHQRNSRSYALSSDGKILFFAPPKEQVLRFSLAEPRWQRISLPKAKSPEQAVVTCHQQDLALCHNNEDGSALLWLWNADNQPGLPYQLPMEHPVEAISWGVEHSLHFVDDDLSLWRIEPPTYQPIRLGRCTHINNQDWISLVDEGRAMFACESSPSLWTPSGDRHLTCAAQHGSAHYSCAVASANGNAFAAINSNDALLFWQHAPGRARPAMLRPTLRLWPLPDGEFLFYEEDGSFNSSPKADEHLWTRWPNGELSLLSDPRLQRWKK